MSEHEGDSRWMGPFVLGFVLGVLVCLGAGGSLVGVMYSRARTEAGQARQAEMEARAAAEERLHQARKAEEEARRDAAKAKAEADRERQAAEENEAKARAALERAKKDSKARPSTSKERAAKAKAITLDIAMQTYYANHNGQYPASVAVLTQPDPENNNKPYVSDDAILDPWGQQYQIDPTGQRNKGAKADVFTVSPDGKTIGNFR